MYRDITVQVPNQADVVFRVFDEMGYGVEGEVTLKRIEGLSLGYISTKEVSEVVGWTMNTELISFTGSVQAIQGDPAEIDRWRVSLSQNVTQYSRLANYEQGFRTQESLQYGPPVRDGEPAELPFSHSSSELTLNGAPVEIKDLNSDDPGWTTPEQITFGGADAEIESAEVRNDLTSWFALARLEAPRMIVLLGRADWTANFDVIFEDGALQLNPASSVQVIDVESITTGLSDIYTGTTVPPLGNGKVVPDLREQASGNDARQGELLENGTQRNTWIYDDEDGAIPFQPRVEPEDDTNWLLLD